MFRSRSISSGSINTKGRLSTTTMTTTTMTTTTMAPTKTMLIAVSNLFCYVFFLRQAGAWQGGVRERNSREKKGTGGENCYLVLAEQAEALRCSESGEGYVEESALLSTAGCAEGETKYNISVPSSFVLGDSSMKPETTEYYDMRY